MGTRSWLLNQNVLGAFVAGGIIISVVWLILLTINVSHGSRIGAGFDIIGFTVSAFCTSWQWELLTGKNHKEKHQDGTDRQASSESYVSSPERTDTGDWPKGNASAAQAEYACKGIPADCSGLVIGEVEAFRAWQVLGDYLASGMGAIWMPGSPMRAEDVDMHTSSGVHAFKSFDDAASYFAQAGVPHAVGKVKLWGTIIEHETGYRAEFGKPLAILECHGGSDAVAIREKYGLGRTAQ